MPKQAQREETPPVRILRKVRHRLAASIQFNILQKSECLGALHMTPRQPEQTCGPRKVLVIGAHACSLPLQDFGSPMHEGVPHMQA